MANCPVCNHEYSEGTVEFCPKCAWNLTPYPLTLGEIPVAIQKREQQTLLWAKKLWEKSYKLHKQNLQLQQQLQPNMKEHQTSGNDLLLEQHLQNISHHIQSLPEMLTLLQHINEHLSYQSQNFYNLYQSQPVINQEYQTSVNETYETNNLSNAAENNHINIQDAEVYELVENYNQHADFPDKIEVSETENSKSQRWGGSQEPVVKTTPSTSQNQPQNPSTLSNSNMKLVSAYNINARSLSNQATTVSESEYTAEQRRLGRNVQPVLESNSRGNYWIIAEGNIEYLVPKAKMKINEHNYLTISTFFHCSGYNPNSSNNFSLIKPAKLSSIGEKWELIEVGELQF